MEKEKVKQGIWTPWAKVVCHDCHGNDNLPNPKTPEEWQKAIEPKELKPDHAVTFCDDCHTDIQVYDSVAYEHNLVKALRDQGIDAVMAQTGGMMSACSITPSEGLQKNGHPSGLGEILITYNDSGDNLYWMGAYDNDASPVDPEWANISFETQEEVLAWMKENHEKIAHLPEPEKTFEDLTREAKERASESNLNQIKEKKKQAHDIER